MLDFPLKKGEAAALQKQLEALPMLLDQAKKNLTDPARELAIIAIRTKEKKVLMFQDLIKRLKSHHPDLVLAAEHALAAVEGYRNWLIQTASQPFGNFDRGSNMSAS